MNARQRQATKQTVLLRTLPRVAQVLGACRSYAPFIVADMCLFVLVRAFGSKWRVLNWLLESIASNYWGRIKENAWWTWHLYITCKSLPEIQEVIDRDLEELTGEDHREWPNVIEDEVEAES